MNALFSPEVISMIVGLIVAFLVAVIPQFESIKAELIAVITVLVGLVIAAFGGERVAAARTSGVTQAERASSAYTAKAAPPPYVRDN